MLDYVRNQNQYMMIKLNYVITYKKKMKIWIVVGFELTKLTVIKSKTRALVHSAIKPAYDL